MKMQGSIAGRVCRVFIFCVLAAPSPAQTNERGAQEVLLTLEGLITEAEASNPALRAALRELEAARLRIPPAGALPDPVLSFGQMSTGNLVPFSRLGRDEMSRISFGVSQDIPLYGKRALRERLAVSEAQAEYWNYEAGRLGVLADLKVAYYELFLQNRTLETWRKNMRLLETYAETAEALYRVGQGNQADVLRAQTELSRLQEQIEVAEQRKSAAEAQINTLLNRPIETPLAPPAAFEKAPLGRSFDELLQMARENFPMLHRQAEMIEANQFSLQLAEKEKYPDLGVLFAYHNRGGLRDLWEIGGMLRIPLYRRQKQNFQVAEANARLEASQERYQSLRAAVQFELKDRYLEAVTSERLLTLLQETIIPQETLTLEATSTSYQVGRVEFLSVMDSLLKLVRDEIRYYEHLTNYQKALARMEPMVGMELTR